MALNDEIQGAWAQHGQDPEGVAALLPNLVERAETADVAMVATLVVHVLGEHLARFEEGLDLLHALLPRVGTDPVNVQALQRSMAVLRMCAGDSLELEALLTRFGAERPGNEARVLALAAAAVGAQGRTNDAARWLVRAASLAYELPDAHPAVRAVAITGNNLACALESRPPTTVEESSLLRSAAQLARVAWERAGTWLEVERAEYRLTMTSLVLGEPYAAVAHAESCRAICTANGAAPLELVFANEARALALHAFGDLAGAREARQVMASLVPDVDPGMAGAVAEALAKLDTKLDATV